MRFVKLVLSIKQAKMLNRLLSEEEARLKSSEWNDKKAYIWAVQNIISLKAQLKTRLLRAYGRR